MKRKLQYYALFLIMILLLIISNSCNATLPHETQNNAVQPAEALPVDPDAENRQSDAYPVEEPIVAEPVQTGDEAYPIQIQPPQQITPERTLEVKPLPAGDVIGLEERVYVDSMDILIMESFPVQVSVQVFGNLPDGCTSIKSTRADLLSNDTFDVHIYTSHPKDTMCTQALVPFEEIIPLEVEGLSAGTYSVKVYGLEATFTLDVDNK